MLCVTGAEKSATSLCERLRRHSTAALQEVRLDLLDDELRLEHLPKDASPLILTCRTVREGGHYRGTEVDRIAALAHAVERVRPGWVDIEACVGPRVIGDFLRRAHEVGTKVILSHHVFDSGGSSRVGTLLASMAQHKADAIKLAIKIDDAAELEPLLHAGTAARAPVILIGMGPAGLLSRALYPRFGSAWTYVASETDNTTAPGQISAAQAKAWRLPPAADAELYVLLGGQQVLGSPGPNVYNALFNARGINACYLPVVTSRPRATLRLLGKLGLRGASITMPLKRQVISMADRVSTQARTVGAANTLVVEKSGHMHALLTDGDGAVAAIEKEGVKVKGKRAILLGAGATTAAIAASLVARGAAVTILARDAMKAKTLGDPIGASSGDLSELRSTPFDILIQTTPVGANDPTATLVPEPTLLAYKIVLDVVLGETKLLADTRANGGVAILGRAMWSQQGRLQLKAWLGIDITAELLERDP